MVSRNYGQFCGVARALDVIGERWALLVVRDLVLGPKRFTDLRHGLPRIPTNILAARLKELEAAGVVRRRILPRPAASVVYELTAYGQELEDIVLRIGRWGAKLLGVPGPVDIVTPDSLVLALRSTFQPEAARELEVDYELHVGDIVLHARVKDGTLSAAEGPLSQPDLIIDTTTALRALLAGEMTPDDAIADGGVRLTGDPGLLTRFVTVFRIQPIPAG